MMKSVFILIIVSLLRGSEGGGGPSDDPIATTPPNLPGGEIANDAPPGPFFAGFSPPFPTDAWWSGFTVTNQDSPVAGPFPYQCSTTNAGLNFGMGDTREFDGVSIKVPTQMDWTVSLTGLPNALDNRKATSWDTQVVCLQYSAGGAGGTMDTCLVPGSPYMTFTYENAGISLTSNGGEITELQWVTPGQKARVTLNNGVYYVIYIIEGTADLSAAGTLITSPPGTSATIRMARVKGPGQEGVLDAHVRTYPTGLDMRYAVQGDIGTTTWTWDVVGDPNQLLILSWPHHRDLLQGANFAEIEYLTLKGPMIGVVGNVWTQRYDLPTISWFAEDPVHPSCLPELVKTLEAEVSALEVMIPGDFYFWGGAFGRASRLALIAEHIGRPDLIDTVVSVLKDSVGPWFDPAHVPAAAFETGWGGFINKEGWNNTWVDFGNAYYNDHHFHYGYLLYGAAVIGKYDQAWLNEHIDFLTHVARDVGNPSPNDPHHTVTRHMDFFAGHSWASGIANGAGPRDQESSGEAINGYYGLLMFAYAINNQPLIDWSRLITAMEIKAAQVYWHLYPNAAPDETPYPEQAFRELTTVGNVMDWQTGAWLFWGDQRTQIAAIQILPLTPIGQVTYDREWMEGVLPYCRGELDDVTIGDAFKSVIYAAYAKVNPQEAYTFSSQLFDWGTGNSASNQLYFVATQPSSSAICSAAEQTPEGLYTIQDTVSGLFVTVSGNGNLAATTSADVLASKFVLGFTPGGGTIQSLTSGMFVTASPNGDMPITASRETPGSYEVFRWKLQPGGESYHLTAMVNRGLVTTSSGEGQLINNANSTNGIPPGTYRLVVAEDPVPINLPASATLKSVENGRFVLASAGATTLMTTGTEAGSATRWGLAVVEDSPELSPYYTIQNLETGQYVTGNMEGSVPLSATAPTPQAWENFQFVAYQGAYIVIHVASGMPVAVQPDDTLMDNTSTISAATMWEVAA